jgi:hypothetical protein
MERARYEHRAGSGREQRNPPAALRGDQRADEQAGRRPEGWKTQPAVGYDNQLSELGPQKTDDGEQRKWNP